ncbi:hypothetical protein ACFFRR_002835 [Megaselia abdita]
MSPSIKHNPSVIIMLYFVSFVVHCLLWGYLYLFWSVERRRAYWRHRNIPYDPPLGVIGSMDGVGSKKHSSQVYQECYQKMKGKGINGYFGIFNFYTPELIVVDPQLIQNILKSKNLKEFGAYTTRLRTHEQLFKPALKSVEELRSLLSETSVLEQQTDIYDLSRRFAIDFVLTSVFDIKSHKIYELDSKHLSHPKFNEVTLTLRRTLPTFFQLKDEFFTKTLSKVIGMDDLYNIGKMLPSDDLAVQSFIGEYETVASTVAFSLYELVLNKQLQDDLRKEVADFDMQLSKLESYDLLERVFRETTRLHPAISKIIRKARKTFALPNFEKPIDKGTIFVIPSHAIHMDPEIFPSPSIFNPDRFLQNNIESRGPSTYLPFGNDSEFVKMLSKLTLVSLLNAFTFDVCKNTEETIAMTPGGVFCTPEKGIFLKVVKK